MAKRGTREHPPSMAGNCQRAMGDRVNSAQRIFTYSLRRAVAKDNSQVWSPAALFGPSDNGFLYDFTDPGTLYTDSALTNPLEFENNPIGSARDLSGNENHASQPTSSRKPGWRYYQGRPGAYFDGSDDFLKTGYQPEAGGFCLLIAFNQTSSGSFGSTAAASGIKVGDGYSAFVLQRQSLQIKLDSDGASWTWGDAISTPQGFVMMANARNDGTGGKIYRNGEMISVARQDRVKNSHNYEPDFYLGAQNANNISTYDLASAHANCSVAGAMLINRELSDTELAQTNQFFCDLVGTPVIES